MNKTYIPMTPYYVPNESRVNPLFDNAHECFEVLMLSFVKRWYERLNHEARTAVRMLKFNPTVVTGMMFFTDGSLDEHCQYFGEYYGEFAKEMSNYALSLALDDEKYEKCQERTNYYWWYSHMAQAIRWYKKGVEDATKLHELTLSVLSGDLRERVLDKIIASDPVCKAAAANYYNALEAGRKDMLRDALLKMRNMRE